MIGSLFLSISRTSFLVTGHFVGDDMSTSVTSLY